MLGFSTWAVLAYHLTSRHLIRPSLVPVLYALAMAAASVAAVGFGRVYDRVGLRGLLALPFLAAAVPFLSFSGHPALFVAGAVVWGAGMGVHDSTMRAAVADLVPAHRRGAGYGTFTAVYGLAWLAGAAAHRLAVRARHHAGRLVRPGDPGRCPGAARSGAPDRTRARPPCRVGVGLCRTHGYEEIPVLAGFPLEESTSSTSDTSGARRVHGRVRAHPGASGILLARPGREFSVTGVVGSPSPG